MTSLHHGHVCLFRPAPTPRPAATFARDAVKGLAHVQRTAAQVARLDDRDGFGLAA